ncbi:MAG: class I mannose-6-phosphate isomerase [Bacteroidaceae bacterium]|nr:class I mannose-6-phosphate isomerase [Bacteroidaceae bacterium]
MIYKFNPILKQTIWGGEKILRFKNIESTLTGVGESWELSAVKGNESVITFGQHIGKTITQLLSEQRELLVGKANYERFGNTFPLLIKFIDANQDLSIQVHPNDEQAERLHGTRGKTEMWYVVDTEQGAHLRSGLSREVSPDEYESKVNDGTITDILCDYQITPGDVFFLPAGRIHSIGKGSFIAEIQETSDITYRIFDFNRVDKNGKPRELHTALAKQVIDFSVKSDYRTHYQTSLNERVELARCPLFTTNLFELTSPKTLSYTALDSFVIWMALDGEVDCECDGIVTTLNAGETILLPATANDFKVTPRTTAKLLEIYIVEPTSK